jgi:hypothetical protein
MNRAFHDVNPPPRAWGSVRNGDLRVAGVTAGPLRSDVEPNDELLGVSGVSLAAGEAARRRLPGGSAR